MNLWTQFIDKLSPKKKVSEEGLNVLSNLPELKTEPLSLTNRLGLMANSGPVCNIADWKQVEKDILLNIEVPLGFKRDEAEPLEIIISVDKSFLFIRDVKDSKPADIYIEDEKGQTQVLKCSVDILKKLMEGQLMLNVIAKGFKAIDFLDATALGGVEVLSPTAFARVQELLIDETIGYMCNACKELSTEELVVIINVGNPFIILPDGTKVEAQVPGTNTDIILQQVPPVTFDSLLDGKSTMMISVPCHLTVKVEMDIIS